MCECKGPSGNNSLTQTLNELEFERGLWSAAQYGEEERAKTLLNKGFPVDRLDSSGYTSLHYAARNGHLNLCKLLIERGANVDAITPHGNATPLHRAAYAGKDEVFKYLLDKNANLLLKDSDGKTALHRAAEGQHLNICKIILKLQPSLKYEKDNNDRLPSFYAKNLNLKNILLN